MFEMNPHGGVPCTHLFFEHTEGARDLLHLSRDVASTDLETLEPTNGSILESYQVRKGLPLVMPRLFEDDLSRLAAVVGPLEVHIPKIVDILRRAFSNWVVDEDVFEYAHPLEGPVVILVFGLHASDERSLRRALAWWLGCLFPADAVE